MSFDQCGPLSRSQPTVDPTYVAFQCTGPSPPRAARVSERCLRPTEANATGGETFFGIGYLWDGSTVYPGLDGSTMKNDRTNDLVPDRTSIPGRNGLDRSTGDERGSLAMCAHATWPQEEEERVCGSPPVLGDERI
ncbi:unnamed protein product [Durusdinium trenchii]|uniref:Uncharacterized protein n=1 Tax=Durusdinium trenchii TaxID=1381693 RepID=A0ABP0MX60_9DINO